MILGHTLPGIRVVDFNTALIVSVLYGLLVTVANVLLIPFAYTLFIWVPRLVWNVLCLLVVNAAVLILLAHFMRGFVISGVQPAVIAVLVMAVVSSVLGMVLE